MNSCHILSKVCELSRMETDSSAKSRIIPNTCLRVHWRADCTLWWTAPFDASPPPLCTRCDGASQLQLAPPAVRQRTKTICDSRKHSTTAGGTLCTQNWHLQHFQITPATCKSPYRERSPLCSQKFAPRHNGGPRYDSKWPPRHNASPLCAQNSHRATTGDRVTIQYGYRATTPATLFTKFAPRHNVRPRYDPKLSPRNTRTLNNDVLLAHREYSNPF